MPIAAVSVWAAIWCPVADMKNTKKITLSAIIAALAASFMLLSYFPYFTYAVPAVAGLFMMVPLVEVGAVWAFASYAVSAALALIFGEMQSALLYVCLFGFYPIVKALIEKINKQAVEWALKLFIFNASAISVFLLSSKLFLISLDDFGALGKYGALIFLLILNAVFVLYDIAISRVSTLYIFKLHDKIKKFVK